MVKIKVTAKSIQVMTGYGPQDIWAQRAKWSSLDVQRNAACCVDLDASQIELLGHLEQHSMLRSFGRRPN